MIIYESLPPTDGEPFTPGGEGGIRTLGTGEGTLVFETSQFNHSCTSPRRKLLKILRPKRQNKFARFALQDYHTYSSQFYKRFAGLQNWTNHMNRLAIAKARTRAPNVRRK